MRVVKAAAVQLSALREVSTCRSSLCWSIRKSGAFKAKTNDPTLAKRLCHTCHTAGATSARDFVYTTYEAR